MKTIQAELKPVAFAVGEVTGALGGLAAVTAAVAGAVSGALCGSLRQATSAAKSLDSQLLVLRLSWGKLKAALSRAAEPVAQMFLPAVQSAVQKATSLANTLGEVTAALFGGAESTETMAKAQTKLASSSKKASRSLANFDQIQRLNKSTGGGSSVSTQQIASQKTKPISRQAAQIVAKIQDLIAPLRQIDLSAAKKAVDSLGEALAKLGRQALSHLEWAWHTLLAPLAKWTLEQAAPAAVELLRDAFSALSAILTPVQAGLQGLLNAMTPAAEFLGRVFTGAISSLGNAFSAMTQVFAEKAPAIGAIFDGLSQIFTSLWSIAGPVLESLWQSWQQTFSAISHRTARDVGFLLDSLGGLMSALSGLLTGDWTRVWTGAVTAVKGAVNLIIGAVNGMLSAVTAGINGILRGINSLSFTAPDWLPAIGGKSFGFHLSPVTAPQIPYLAQGAVLPANRPFLAVVGDQKNGTNIEAPLSTIEAAVASVLSRQGGDGRIVARLDDILQALLSVELGDATIGEAARRYTARVARMEGCL